MTLTFTRATFEVTRRHLYASFGGREWLVTREPGQPLTMFLKQRHGQELALWGLGFHAVIPWA